MKLIFLCNKYSIYYFNIINAARARKNINKGEKHHIIPKSLGGTDNIDNLVLLTEREHFICHLLLTKMTEGINKSKMYNAVWWMANRMEINSRIYERLKKENSLLKSREMTGEKNFFFGKTHSEDTKRKLSEKHRGKTLSDEHKKKISERLKGRQVSEDTRRKLSEGKLGKQRSAITCQKLSKSHTGKKRSQKQKDGIRNQRRYVCEYCGKQTIKTNYLRWHGNKCKLFFNDIDIVSI